MKKLIVIAALALLSTHASAEDNLTQEQACNLGYVSTECDAAEVQQVAAKPVQLATPPVVVVALHTVDIPYLNEGYFGGDGE